MAAPPAKNPAPEAMVDPELPAPRDAADHARDRGDHAVAAALYRRHLRLFPRDAAIWVQLGHMLKDSGALADAEAAYLESIALAPDIADTHLQLGHARKLAGALEDAQAAYAQALRLDPDCPDARAELAALVAQRLRGLEAGDAAPATPGMLALHRLLTALRASDAPTYALFQRPPFRATPAAGARA